MNPLAALYGSWMGVPAAVREPVRSAVVSLGFGLQNIAFALYGGYAVYAGELHVDQSLHGFLAFCGKAWFVTLGATLSAAYRAKQSAKNVANTIALDDGSQAVVKSGPSKVTP